MDSAVADTTTATSSLTDSQERLLNILGIVSGSLSICGSTLIMTRIIRCQSYKGSPYNRIMMGLCVSDIISSIANGFPFLFLPKETSPRVWAFGNETTCNMLGFLTQVGYAAIWYNGLLSLYYLITVRFGVKRKEFASKYEVWFHLSAILYFIGTGIAGLIIDLYGEFRVTQSCWVYYYPNDCYPEDDLDDSCKSPVVLGMLFGATPFMLVFLELPINNLVIYCHVRRTVGKFVDATPTSRTKISEEEGEEEGEEEEGKAVVVISQELEELQKDRIKEVATQGFLYVVFFYISYLPAFIVKVLDTFLGLDAAGEVDIYWLLVLQYAMMPLQGWFNLFIYMRPNYVRVRKVCPEKGIWWAMKVSWLERKIPTLEQSHSIVRQIHRQPSSSMRPNPTVASSPHHKMKRTVVVPSSIIHFEEHSNGDDTFSGAGR